MTAFAHASETLLLCTHIEKAVNAVSLGLKISISSMRNIEPLLAPPDKC